MIVELGIAALPVAGCLVGLFLGRRAWPRYVSTPWVPTQLRELAARLGYDRRGFEEGEALSRRINDELIGAQIRAFNAEKNEDLADAQLQAADEQMELLKRKLQETERRVYNQRAELRRWEEKAQKRRDKLKDDLTTYTEKKASPDLFFGWTAGPMTNRSISGLPVLISTNLQKGPATNNIYSDYTYSDGHLVTVRWEGEAEAAKWHDLASLLYTRAVVYVDPGALSVSKRIYVDHNHNLHVAGEKVGEISGVREGFYPLV